MSKSNRWSTNCPSLVLLSGSPAFIGRIESDLALVLKTAVGRSLLGSMQACAGKHAIVIMEADSLLRHHWNIKARAATTLPTVAVPAGEKLTTQILFRPVCPASGAGGLTEFDCDSIRNAYAAGVSAATLRSWSRSRSNREGDRAGDRGVSSTIILDPFEWPQEPTDGQSSSTDILVHELLHSLQYLQGRVDLVPFTDKRRFRQYDCLAEAEAMGWENAHRVERRPSAGIIDYRRNPIV